MANYFKYCTKEQEIEFLKSLNFGEVKTLYTVSNEIDAHYEYLEISKKSGGKRRLMMPDSLLKHIQKKILKHILYGFQISSYAKAYHRKSDILDNAIPHVGKHMILKLDLKQFFDHITFDMVKNEVFKESYFPEATRSLLTILCCYQNKLPQGAPTSPTISNIILKDLDEEIGKWCFARQIMYTRYCDDFTFSGDFHPKEVMKFVEEKVTEYGFLLNHKKTRVLTQKKRQIVTGIVVNEKVNVPREYQKMVRQEMYYIKKFGVSEHLKRLKLDIDSSDYLKSLKGKILFILHVNSTTEFQTYLKELEKM